MKVLVASLLLFVSVQNISFAQRTFISPGIKLGYQFGKDGGFTFGIEMSLTFWERKGPIYGVVVAVDGFKAKYDYHLGLELTNGIGLEVGPTISERYGYDLGFRATVFTGLILYPYYCYTYMKKNPNQHQIGTFIKVPIQVDGERISLGG